MNTSIRRLLGRARRVVSPFRAVRVLSARVEGLEAELRTTKDSLDSATLAQQHLVEALKALDRAGAARHTEISAAVAEQHSALSSAVDARQQELRSLLQSNNDNALAAAAQRHEDLWNHVTGVHHTIAALQSSLHEALDQLSRQIDGAVELTRQLHADDWQAANERDDRALRNLEHTIDVIGGRIDELMGAVSEAKLDAWKAADDRHEALVELIRKGRA